MKKLIIIILALLTIGCNKVEEPTQKEVVTQPATVEPIEYPFAQQISHSVKIELEDMSGSALGFFVVNKCTPANFTLEDGVSYRLVMNVKAPNNQYTILIWEGVVTSNDGVLTYSKTGGSDNMYYDSDCGYLVHVVK